MNYEDLKKASDWYSLLNQAYVEEIGGAPVFVFKLDKVATKVDPLYGEEIGGRIYLRPFEIKAMHLINPFEFMFHDNLIGEIESNVKSFNFNFNQMVQTIYNLKNKPVCTIHVTSVNPVGISKIKNVIYLYYNGLVTDSISISEIATMSDLLIELNAIPGTTATLEGMNDFTKNLPDFPRIDFENAELLLKTFNKEYKNCSDVIENGDLVLVEEQMRLYEVTSAQPAGSYGWKYQMWNIKCDTAYPYVEFNRLKSQVYGLKGARVQINP